MSLWIDSDQAMSDKECLVMEVRRKGVCRRWGSMMLAMSEGSVPDGSLVNKRIKLYRRVHTADKLSLSSSRSPFAPHWFGAGTNIHSFPSSSI
jgi:hypothetical protein